MAGTARWVWPVGIWRGRKPEISSGWDSPRRASGGQVISHGGVDVMWRRRPGDPWEPRTKRGSLHYVLPPDRPALAAGAGKVRFATTTPRGGTVIIDHPGGMSTYYTHLEGPLLVERGADVGAGQPVGIIGADPLDKAGLAHLHFELWRRRTASTRVDPAPMMRGWAMVADPFERAVG